jgi:hypothetical protein
VESLVSGKGAIAGFLLLTNESYLSKMWTFRENWEGVHK